MLVLGIVASLLGVNQFLTQSQRFAGLCHGDGLWWCLYFSVDE
jgi:hypothetical protein